MLYKIMSKGFFIHIHIFLTNSTIRGYSGSLKLPPAIWEEAFHQVAADATSTDEASLTIMRII